MNRAKPPAPLHRIAGPATIVATAVCIVLAGCGGQVERSVPDTVQARPGRGATATSAPSPHASSDATPAVTSFVARPEASPDASDTG